MSHLLEVKNLTTAFTGDYGRNISVDHVSFHVDPGEVVCIVGESGCGKSVTSLSIMEKKMMLFLDLLKMVNLRYKVNLLI